MVSLAAALAIVGAGVALARTERERRAAARSRRARSASLLAEEPAIAGLRRVVVGQLDVAIELLEGYPGESREHTVHETRKALKRARAIVRLLREQFGDPRVARENAALRDCARRLAGARDAVVMLDTLDGLLKRHPELAEDHSADGGDGVRALRAQLLAEREGAIVDGERAGANRGVVTGASTAATGASTADHTEIERHRAVAGELLAIRERIAAWDLSDRGRASSKLLAAGIERLYRQGRRRMRRARRRRRDVAAMHAWRKSAKDLRYVAETLDRPGASRRHKSAKRLKRVAGRADRLGETLGEEHDLALLSRTVRRHSKRFPGRRRSYKPLLKAIERRRKRLRNRALREGERLYRRKPRRFVRRVRSAL
jgi:CHAD domain-containing protein